MIIESISEILFPKRCVSCRKWGNYLCHDCLKQITFLERQYCPGCKKESIVGVRHSHCHTRSNIDQLYVLCWYKGVVRTLIGKFKFETRLLDLKETLAQIIYRALVSEELSFWSDAVIVPVPLHPRRERERGFNQSYVLSELLAKVTNNQVDSSLLIRRLNTKHQSTTVRSLRAANIANAFSVTVREVYPRKVILVDDVYTTGSTLEECAHTLKVQTDIEKIFAFTLAKG